MSSRFVCAPLMQFGRLLADRFRQVRVQQAAASLAFTTLLSLVPLIAVSVGVIARFPVFDQIGNGLRTFLLNNLLPDKAGVVIAKYTLQFSQQANKLTAVGSAMLFVAAIVMLLTIDRVFHQIWQVQRQRPLLARLSIYWAVLTLGPLALGGAVIGATAVMTASLGLVNEPDWVRTGAFRLVPALVLCGFLSFLYYAMPNRRVRLCHALIGGAAAALMMLATQRLFGLYLANFGSYTLIYGAFAVVPVFLIWLYACWVVILLGALISALVPEYLAGHRTCARFAGDGYYGACLMLAALGRAQAAGHTCATRQLATDSRLSIADAECTLEALRAAGWVEKTDRHHWLLSVTLASLTVGAVFERFAFASHSLPEPQNEAERVLADRLRALHANAAEPLAIPLTALVLPDPPAA